MWRTFTIKNLTFCLLYQTSPTPLSLKRAGKWQSPIAWFDSTIHCMCYVYIHVRCPTHRPSMKRGPSRRILMIPGALLEGGGASCMTGHPVGSSILCYKIIPPELDQAEHQEREIWQKKRWTVLSSNLKKPPMSWVSLEFTFFKA